MATVNILKSDGSQAGQLELKDSVFAVQPNAHCIRAAVSQYLANQRSGTHATKMRGAVSGGGRKPWRQKGTGRARQGSIRAPQWRHGAIIFGPQPRDYGFTVNQKVKQKAFCSIWSELVQANRLIVVESIELEQPKTKRMVEILTALGVAGSVLLLTEKTDPKAALSARNVPWIKTLNVNNLNVYDLLNHDWVVSTPEAIKRVEATYA
jgi:large subunit ribosomal protein L4